MKIIILIFIIIIAVWLFKQFNTKLTDIKIWQVLLLFLVFKRSRSEKKTYFIRSGNEVKIGTSINVEQRLKQIKTSRPNSYIYGYINRNIERKLQKRFKNQHTGGEWFYFEPIKKYIDNILKSKEL